MGCGHGASPTKPSLQCPPKIAHSEGAPARTGYHSSSKRRLPRIAALAAFLPFYAQKEKRQPTVAHRRLGPAHLSRLAIPHVLAPPPRPQKLLIAPIFIADSVSLAVSREKDGKLRIVYAGWENANVGRVPPGKVGAPADTHRQKIQAEDSM